MCLKFFNSKNIRKILYSSCEFCHNIFILRLSMRQIKNDERLTETEKLAMNLMQLIDVVSSIMCKLKDTYCLIDGANVNYGDDLRSTTIPAYCGCRSRDCKINPLVRSHKEAIQTFDHLWPQLGYTILL